MQPNIFHPNESILHADSTNYISFSDGADAKLTCLIQAVLLVICNTGGGACMHSL